MACYLCYGGSRAVVGNMLAWVMQVTSLRGQHASVGGVVDELAWMACQHGWVGWRANMGGVRSVLTWVACYYYCCYY